jgi:hypothetical protein
VESFEIWCWRRIEKISWTDHVRNEEVLHSQGGEEYNVHTLKNREVNWIGHILRRNCFLKNIIKRNIEGRIEIMGG